MGNRIVLVALALAAGLLAACEAGGRIGDRCNSTDECAAELVCLKFKCIAGPEGAGGLTFTPASATPPPAMPDAGRDAGRDAGPPPPPPPPPDMGPPPPPPDMGPPAEDMGPPAGDMGPPAGDMGPAADAG